jgi:hypothetical protein
VALATSVFTCIPEDFEAASMQLFGEWWGDGNERRTTFDPFDGYKVEMGEQKQVSTGRDPYGGN